MKKELVETCEPLRDRLTEFAGFLDKDLEKLSHTGKRNPLPSIYLTTNSIDEAIQRAKLLRTACQIIERAFKEKDKEAQRTLISPEMDNTYILLNPTQDMAEGVLKASTYYNLISNESYARFTAKLNPSALRQELQPQHTEAPKHAAPANDTPERELGPVEIAPGFSQGPQA